MGGEVGGGAGAGEQRCVVLELPAKEEESGTAGSSSFDLERAVCSHGLFMMAPNCWDPLSKTLTRPLRLSSSPDISLPVRISLPPSPSPSPSPSRPLLLLSVLGPDLSLSLSLSSQDLLSISVFCFHFRAVRLQFKVYLSEIGLLQDQVRRMLRISIDNDRAIREFHDLHAGARASGFGRVFRSPTLFEDMVKCILLCNCQWPRSLSMARALCELQLELHGSKPSEHFLPETPQSRRVKRKRKTKHDPPVKETSQLPPIDRIGDFPSPEELANLDADYLAKRCKLGYRAQRIVSLAKNIVEGKLEIKKLEELCDGYAPSSYDKLDEELSRLSGFGPYAPSSYDKLDEELSRLSGFGPFTRANVLMCMGFYHKIPADSETIRHLKQFHRRSCAVQSVQKDIDAIYGKYAPYQFLAYWSEVWDFYEKQFGKTSDMPPSHYRLITASNMRRKATERSSR